MKFRSKLQGASIFLALLAPVSSSQICYLNRSLSSIPRAVRIELIPSMDARDISNFLAPKSSARPRPFVNRFPYTLYPARLRRSIPLFKSRAGESKVLPATEDASTSYRRSNNPSSPEPKAWPRLVRGKMKCSNVSIKKSNFLLDVPSDT